MSRAKETLMQAPVVPVLTIGKLGQAVPLARALVAGGLPVLEVTLRTDIALEAIAAISQEVPEAIVGAGTVVNPSDFAQACAAGSRFIVSPGVTPSLLECAANSSIPLIPGVATVSEMMLALDFGIDCLKFFPAEAAGGTAVLKAFSGPFPNVSFCPTGGIGLHNLEEYLSLRAVITVGGTWLTPTSLLESGDWDGITALASDASKRVSDFRSKV